MDDAAAMHRAVDLAASVRASTSPNPWVGCVLVSGSGDILGEGATDPPGGPHAEAAALADARSRGNQTRGATAFVTLEPCSHHGRTPPCAEALVDAGVAGSSSPSKTPTATSPAPASTGSVRRASTWTSASGPMLVRRQLAPYLDHRRTGRPLVVLKLAATPRRPHGGTRRVQPVDHRAGCPGRRPSPASRERRGPGRRRHGAGRRPVAHGARRVRPRPAPGGARPRPEGARVHPCLELDGRPRRRARPARRQGGAAGAGRGRGQGGRSVPPRRPGRPLRLYLAPALFGGDDGRGLFAGAGVATIADVWRGRITAVIRLGADLRVDLLPEMSEV